MTVSRWERGTAIPTAYQRQQLMLLEKGAERMDAEAREKMLHLLAMGVFVVCMAFIVSLAVAEAEARSRP